MMLHLKVSPGVGDCCSAVARPNLLRAQPCRVHDRTRCVAITGTTVLMHSLGISTRTKQLRALRSGSRRNFITCAALQPAQPGKTVLGFVGIGIMGLAMCQNLIKAGYEVVIWNRNADKCTPLTAAGAKLAGSPKEVAQKSSYTFAMLSDPTAAVEVATATNGVAAGLSAGKGYVDASTVDAATSRHIAEAVRATGAAFLEAPVSGSKAPAEQGTLIFLSAGDKNLFEAVAAPLDAMGKRSFFLGNAGAGANMKLVVNMMLGGVMASFAESLALAGKVGLQEKDLVEVLGLGALASPMLAGKGLSMVARKYAPAFPLKHQQKDLRLALELAEGVQQKLPVTAAANELYKDAQAAGRGDDDFSAVLEALLRN